MNILVLVDGRVERVLHGVKSIQHVELTARDEGLLEALMIESTTGYHLLPPNGVELERLDG